MAEKETPEQAEARPPSPDLFVSYAREDRRFVERLTQALTERGKKAWVDLENIPASAEWMAEISQAIESSGAVVAVLSPDFCASRVCTEETTRAAVDGKRIIPVLHREVEPDTVPEELAKRNWIMLRDTDDFETGISTLVDALDTDLDHVKTHTALLTKAAEWQTRGEHRNQLLRGGDLAEAEAWLATSQEKDPRPTSLQARYLAASRKASSTRQRRVVVGVTLALVLALLLSAVAVVQRGEAVHQRAEARRQANAALSRGLGAQGLLSLEAEPDLGTLLAVQSYRTDPTTQSLSAMLSVLGTGGSPTRTIQTSSTSLAALSATGDVIATGDDAGDVRTLDISTGASTGPVIHTGQGPVSGIACDSEGDLIASGDDGTVRAWNPQTGETVGQGFPKPAGMAKDAAVSLVPVPDGKSVAVLWHDGSVRFLRTPDLTQVGRVIRVAPAAATAQIRLSPDGGTLAVGDNANLELWDVAHRQLLVELPGKLQEVMSVVFSPDGSEVFAGGGNGTVLAWDTETGKPQPAPRPKAGEVHGLALSPDGKTLATGTTDGVIRLWDAATGKPAGLPLRGHSGSVTDLTFIGDGSYLLSSGHDGTVRYWTTSDAGSLSTTIRDKGWWIAPGAAFLSPTEVISMNWQGLVLIQDPVTGKIEKQFQAGEGVWSSGVYDNTLAFNAGRSGEDAIRLWNLGSPKATPEVLWSTKDGTWSLAVSPTGNFLAASENRDGPIRLWDLRTGEPAGSLMGHSGPSLSLAFTPDGKLLASASKDGTARIWDVSSGAEAGDPLKLGGDTSVPLAVAFSPDGRTLAVGWSVGTTQIVDVATGRAIGAPLHGSESGVLALAFNPDGRTLAAGMNNGTTTLWDVASRKQLGAPIGSGSFVLSVAFSPDGKMLAVGAQGGVLKIWNSILWSRETAPLMSNLCAKVGRNLTTDEWRTYLPDQPYEKTCPQFPAG